MALGIGSDKSAAKTIALQRLSDDRLKKKGLESIEEDGFHTINYLRMKPLN
jgi:hypothetical protein